MAVTVRRTNHEWTYRSGRGTLAQRFVFDGADARAICDVLLTAPLVGERSIFGSRPGREHGRSSTSRTMRGFSPAPGFRFDVDLTAIEPCVFLVQFSQPDLQVPYLRGDVLWTISNEDGSAVFEEEINTDRALAVVAEPLGGPEPSLRRWLFFRAGHGRVMLAATSNIAALVEDPARDS